MSIENKEKQRPQREACQKLSIKGKERCRNHGGASTKNGVTTASKRKNLV